jgi:hypothetical protein
LKTLQAYKVSGAKELPEPESCTSIPQQWHVPRGKKILPIPTIRAVAAKPRLGRKRKPVLGRNGSLKK